MVKSIIRSLMHVSLVCCLIFSLSAASIIQTAIDKNIFTAGERLTLKITAIVPPGTSVIPPSTDNGFGSIIVKEWNAQRKERQGSDSVTFSYMVTVYIPEKCTIPSLPFIIQTTPKADTLHSLSIPLEFKSVVDKETVDIKDLKTQQTAGKAPIWWIIVIIIVVAIIITLIIINRLKSNSNLKNAGSPLLPPYEEAMSLIHELERKKYIDRGLYREYVFEVSEILKRYIERRFTINASEFTTEEMLAWLGVSGLDTKLKQLIEWFFRTSDPIKFARQIPDLSTTERFMKETLEFLNATRPILSDTNTVSSASASAAKTPSTTGANK
jgi:hypothetical protein